MLKKIIDTNALKHNAVQLKLIAGTRQLGAVVKADAYGFDIVNVVKTINENVGFFCVASSGEASKILSLTKKEILILTPREKILMASNVSYTICNFADILELEAVGALEDRRISLHIKLDTGMCRLGIKNKNEFEEIVEYIKKSKFLVLKGIYTHFASSDKKHILCQDKKFRAFLKDIKLPRHILIHSASSTIVFSKLHTCGNAIRCGLALYGGILKCGLKPVLSAYADVVQIKDLNIGDEVSYGATFITKNKMKIAILNCGYYDGISRKLSNNGFFIINGQSCKILGRVCMDLIVVNVTSKKVKVGDKAYLINAKQNVENIANKSETICYEVFTSLKNYDILYI